MFLVMCAAGYCGKWDLSLIKLSGAGALLLVRLDECRVSIDTSDYQKPSIYTTGYVFTMCVWGKGGAAG